MQSLVESRRIGSVPLLSPFIFKESERYMIQQINPHLTASEQISLLQQNFVRVARQHRHLQCHHFSELYP
jgi:glucan biosynthesis protein